MKKKRPYRKKSPYWSNLSKAVKTGPDSFEVPFVEPVSCGENYYEYSSAASCPAGTTSRDSGSSSSPRRSNRAHLPAKQNKYTNIKHSSLPYKVSADGVDCRESIELCQKAYANIPIFRNAIDVMSEFSNSEIHLEGGTETSRTFIYKWFEKINLWKLKDQFFREYYRSGNIFLYRVDGDFDNQDFKNLNKIYGSKEYLNPGRIPIRYILLNPYDIVSTSSTSFDKGVYKKILSEYELERLRNPKTEEDQNVFDALPEEAKEAIKKGSFSNVGLKVELDPDRLVYSFYKKQDYEPFAIPFGFPVLDDLNWKIELKKIDQAISRTIENVVLLITMGAEPDKGGINPHSLGAMQCLFQNESVGRVLVSDYTTKADFIIPDINKILGPNKYEIVNQDIREGLQNIIVGKENYSSTQIKAQIFLERLKEARNCFINDFMMPQIKTVCKALGFRKYPTLKFQEIDIKDEVQFQRIITRLLEIGVISPEQGMKSIRTGLFPNPESLEEAQKEYSQQRSEGLYNPLVGGVPAVEAPGSEEDRKLKEEQIKKSSKNVNVNNQNLNKKNTPNQTGRPLGAKANEKFSRKNIQSVVYQIENLRTSIAKQVRSKFSVKRLNKTQESIIDSLLESIVCSKKKEVWEETAKACISDSEKMSELTCLEDIVDISAEHQLSEYPSAILYHSNNIK